MKNYTQKCILEERGYMEVPESEYTDRQNEIKKYIGMLSDVVVDAQCGWDKLKYKVMSYHGEFNEKYMVLCVDGREVRWIPITGNSKGCILQVLGENLW